jgi:hypothetical protein
MVKEWNQVRKQRMRRECVGKGEEGMEGWRRIQDEELFNL